MPLRGLVRLELRKRSPAVHSGTRAPSAAAQSKVARIDEELRDKVLAAKAEYEGALRLKYYHFR
jgi:hypothetical protein